MSLDASAAAVVGLVRSDPRGPGITRTRSRDGFRYAYPSGADVTQEDTVRRITALAIPPGWEHVWISPDLLGHIQATGVDSPGPDPVSLPPAMARAAGRAEIRSHAALRRGTAQTAGGHHQ